MNHTYRCLIVPMLALLVLCWASPAYASKDENHSRIQKLEKQVAALIAAVETLQNEDNDHQQQIDALKARVTTLESKVSILETEVGQLKTTVANHTTQIAGLLSVTTQQQQQIDEILPILNATKASAEASADKLFHFSRSGTDVFITGANLHIVNGSNDQETTNTLGNLFLGYKSVANFHPQTGSHNLILGSTNGFTGYGSIVSGENNIVRNNSAIFGGRFNSISSGISGVIVGGEFNNVASNYAAAIGGMQNVAGGGANGAGAVCVGGLNNVASGDRSATVAGSNTLALGPMSSVTGGFGNQALAPGSSVSGGASRVAAGSGSWAAGGLFQPN